MATTSLPANHGDREVYLREHGAARYVKMIQEAGPQSTGTIMTIRSFDGEPEVFYVALEYAYDSGVGVTLVERSPSSEQ